MKLSRNLRNPETTAFSPTNGLNKMENFVSLKAYMYMYIFIYIIYIVCIYTYIWMYAYTIYKVYTHKN